MDTPAVSTAIDCAGIFVIAINPIPCIPSKSIAAEVRHASYIPWKGFVAAGSTGTTAAAVIERASIAVFAVSTGLGVPAGSIRAEIVRTEIAVTAIDGYGNALAYRWITLALQTGITRDGAIGRRRARGAGGRDRGFRRREPERGILVEGGGRIRLTCCDAMARA